MRPIFIFGDGGHARVVASLLDRDVTFVNHDTEAGFFDQIEVNRKAEIYLGVGSGEDRRRIFEKLSGFGIAPMSCIAPTAFVAKTALVGAGAVICPGAVVMAGAAIGAGVIVNTLSSVDHDCWIGDFTQITVGVTIPGDVKIGVDCFFGIKSATFPGVTIGNHVVVRGGSLVIRDVPSDVVVGGNPAVVIRQNVHRAGF